MMSNKLTLTLLCLVPLVTRTFAWKSEGHLLVARIAFDKLQAEDSAALKKANTLLAVATKENPTLNDAEGSYPFVESATLADTIKYRGGGWQSDWHFVDAPFLDEGGDVSDYPDFKLSSTNITEAIKGILAWINEEDGYKDSFVYTTMMKHMQDEKYGQSYALRLLIHYMGDIHQPLHCLSRVDSTYPAGDRGGNSFKVPNHYEADNLHSVWDSVVYEFHKNDKLPYNDDTWAAVGEHTKALVNKVQISTNEYKNLKIDQWAEETFKIGTDNAYSGIKEGDKLPEDYVSKNNALAEKQVVLAGYRLAYMIESLFGSAKTVDIAPIEVDEDAVAQDTLFLQ